MSESLVINHYNKESIEWSVKAIFVSKILRSIIGLLMKQRQDREICANRLTCYITSGNINIATLYVSCVQTNFVFY